MKRILHCVDMQGSFMDPRCKELYVNGAWPLIDETNVFLGSLPKDYFDSAIFTYDTHFWFEYNNSPEAELFPSIHCEYGSEGWSLAVLSTRVGDIPAWHIYKNEFDFWGQNRLTDRIQILDTILNDYPMLQSFESVAKKLGVNLDDTTPVAELLPKTAKAELKKYLGDKGNIVIVPLRQEAKTEGIFIFEKDGQRTALAFVRENLVQAYKDLFHFHQKTVSRNAPRIHRDEFLKDIGADTEVVIAGVASDYCVKQAIVGYLQRGCQVVILQDLVKGIGQQIDEVAQSPELKKYYESGQLKLMDSIVYLNSRCDQNREKHRKSIPTIKLMP